MAGYGRTDTSGWSAGRTTYGRKTDGTDGPTSQAADGAQFFFCASSFLLCVIFLILIALTKPCHQVASAPPHTMHNGAVSLGFHARHFPPSQRRPVGGAHTTSDTSPSDALGGTDRSGTLGGRGRGGEDGERGGDRKRKGRNEKRRERRKGGGQ